MAKRQIAVYISPNIYDRLEKARSDRKKLSPPGWNSISSYAAYLLEEEVKREEKIIKKLKDEKTLGEGEGD